MAAVAGAPYLWAFVIGLAWVLTPLLVARCPMPLWGSRDL